MKTALIIRHLAFEDLGNLKPILEEQGYRLHYVDAGVDNLAKLNPAEPDLVIILGGPIGADDERDYPFLQDESRLLEYRLTTDLPTLGICLGAQLIAKVLGGKISPGTKGKEIGWFPINLTAAGQKSVLQPLSNAQAVLHWHGDIFTLPEGCVRLASSEKYENQAFSYKLNILALQFHPEVLSQTLDQWFIGHAWEIGATPDVTVAQLRQDTGQYADALQGLAANCWRQWLNQINPISPLREQPMNFRY